MCTVVVSIDPSAEIPLIVVGVRDEFTDRPWVPPGEHWPGERPGLIGGRDLRGGGTWLAVDPGSRRVGAVLNGHGLPAPDATRRSRGDLPLIAAAGEDLPESGLGGYDPFHLLRADLGGARLWHWDGVALGREDLPPGTHMIVNSGWERGEEDERVAFFRPLFAAAERPSGLDGPWERWRELATGAGVPSGDPRTMIVNRDLPEGRVFGSVSVTLLGLAPGGVRYEFTADPRDPAAFGVILPE
ncbi:NRDE family protein [Streptosporangium sp. NPDC050855]|uniref:NRDE family protein n=1 Tax=Streptosporangium sp. NPDC050855 TaxID=3366194 RepID=UPI0037B90A90